MQFNNEFYKVKRNKWRCNVLLEYYIRKLEAEFQKDKTISSANKYLLNDKYGHKASRAQTNYFFNL